MIELTNVEKKWILRCKGHLCEEMPFKGTWADTFKPVFLETYGWEADCDMYGYYRGTFSKLLSIYKKIATNEESYERNLREIFDATFYAGISNDCAQPVERAIHCLRGFISNNQVVENDIERYSLKL